MLLKLTFRPSSGLFIDKRRERRSMATAKMAKTASLGELKLDEERYVELLTKLIGEVCACQSVKHQFFSSVFLSAEAASHNSAPHARGHT